VKLTMVRVFRHYVPVQLLLLAALEAATLFASMYLGVALRFAGHDIDELGAIYPRAIAFSAVMLGCLTAFGFYMRETPKGNWSYYARFMAAFLVGWVVMTLVFYIYPGLFLGRGAFGLAFFFAFSGTALGRMVFFRVVDQQALQRRVLVLGAGTRAAEVGKLLRANPSGHKFHLVGYLPIRDSEHAVEPSEILTEKRPLLSIVHKYAVDEVVVGIRDRRNGGLCMSDLLECKLEGVTVTDLSTFFERETGHVQLDSLNPSWMVFSDGFQRGSYKTVVKRGFDVAVSLLLLLLTLPIMALTAVLIYLETGLPIFYRQERVGECGQVFKILKFRSMRQDAERAGAPQWARQNDDRVTRVGRVIRLLRIDELPQIFNVLKGDMSFVGPRPERPFFVQELAKQIPFYLNRHTVKPGITGWAQIRYPYGASVQDAMRKLQYDLYYAKNYSLFLDLIILFQTAQVILFGKGAR
jgi:sugar transferase (PEP-CTERM system associated)